MKHNVNELFTQVLDVHRNVNGKIVLALSGGVDSRVMLHLLNSYCHAHHCHVIAVHVHHGLSSNADEWANQCEQWCADINIPFYLEKVDISDVRKDSLEQAARVARYEALKHYIGSDDVLITGHHSDDQLETFLLALKRGSGPKGLSSMADVIPFHQGMLVRPLLRVTRQCIEKYASVHQLEWITDESNSDTRFDRNYIRHEITPILESRWPHIRRSIQRSAELCAQQEHVIELLLSEEYRRFCRDDNGLSISDLKGKPNMIRNQLIRFWFSSQNVPMPSKKHLSMIWSEIVLAKRDANPVLQLGNKQIRRFNDCLYCVDIYHNISSWCCNIKAETAVSLPDNLGIISLIHSKQEGTLDAKILNTALTLTFNPEGLTATPNGRHGIKTLKHWFQEYRIPSWLRRRTPILLSKNQVVAVAGVFVSREYSGQELELKWDKCVCS